MDEMNDIRATLGTIRNRLNEVNERVQRIEKVAELTEWVNDQINTFPERVDQLTKSIENNPMLSMVAPALVPQLRELAEDIRKRRNEPAE